MIEVLFGIFIALIFLGAIAWPFWALLSRKLKIKELRNSSDFSDNDDRRRAKAAEIEALEDELAKVFGWRTFAISGGMLVVAILLLVLNNSWFMAERGKFYVAQNVWGHQTGIIDTGPTANFLGSVREYDRLMTIIIAGTKAGEIDTSAGDVREEGEGSTRRIKWDVPAGAYPPVECRLSDGVLAWVQGTFNFPMPASAQKLVALGNEFTSNQAFIEGVAIPNVQEIIRTACRMTSAQDYYSGNAGVLESGIKDMLSQGATYVVEVRMEDLPQNEVQKDGINSQIDRPDSVKYISELRKDSNGKPLLTRLKIKDYEINPTASITDVTPEPKFELRMAKSRDKAADRNLARQEITVANEQERANVARGNADLAKRNAELKLQQAEAVTLAETEAKRAVEDKKRADTQAQQRMSVADIDRQTAEIALKTAELQAAATRATGAAEADVRKLLAESDGSLSLRLQNQKEMAIGVATALANGQNALVPVNVVGGGNGTNATPSALDTIMSMMAIQTANNLQTANNQR